MDSPLKVNSYFFPLVHVAADAEYRPGDKGKTDPEYDIRTSVTKDEQDGSYQVGVEIISEAKSENERQAYTVHLIVIGIFEVHPDWPDPEKLLRINGASILYSAAREFLITVTSRGPWGAESLPTVSFLKMEKPSKEASVSQKSEEIQKKAKPTPKKKAEPTPKKSGIKRIR